MIRVGSLMWGTAWSRYGRTFKETFVANWPSRISLVIVTDTVLPLFDYQQIRLDWIPECEAFRRRHADSPAANGIINGEYAWRHDAVKWMPQGLAPVAIIDGMDDDDIFVWFDADVETTSHVPAGWIESLLGDADVSCLQREGTHSEIGFYALRIGPKTRMVLQQFKRFYTEDTVFALAQQHSAFVFDRALETQPDLKIRNLSPGMRGHVWPHTALAAHTIHKKGKRKDK